MIKERQKLAVYAAILVLLVNLSLSIVLQQNFRWQNSENSMGFQNPILLFTNSNLINLSSIEKRQSSQAAYLKKRSPRFNLLANYLDSNYSLDTHIAKQKLLKIYQNYKLEGG
ncbi:MAG TPA: hypothetical protein ENK21_02665 [Trueperaceae bacterium]|nr:hypothetical protein [Trueperaceae bacterium]